MEKATRSELLSTIEFQKEQLKRYESRLRDVVRAYKGLVTEKEALEASVKVLTSASHDPNSQSPSATTTTFSNSTVTKTPTTEQYDLQVEDERQDEAQRREQIHTLSASLATLTQEKSRLEASLIADKKKLMVENNELRVALEVETKQRLSETEKLQSQLSEVRGSLRCQQLERETEQTNHGIMLKELQLLLAEERSTREQLEHQLEGLQSTDKESFPHQEEEENQRIILDLTKELNAARIQLEKVCVQSEESTSPCLDELQSEIEKIKKSYQQQVCDEARRANEAEMRLRVSGKQAEERICSLESKLSEISSIMGSYDKLRLKDQEMISRLKERVSQLDHENAALSSASITTPSSAAAAAANASDSQHSFDPKSLADKVLYYHGLLMAANEKTDSPIDIQSLLGFEDHGYKQQLDNLREEFERYKLRAQSVLKTKNKDSASGGGKQAEVEVLQDQVAHLRDKMRQLHQQHADSLQDSKLRVEHLTKSLQSLQDQHRQGEANLLSQHAKQIKEMEQQLRKQRERTITMLAEKETEIMSLRNACGQSLEVEYLREMRGGCVPLEQRESGEEEGLAGSLKQLFMEPAGGPKGETLMLHLAQEQARREVELGALRRQRRQAEGALRDLQHSSSLKQEALIEENNQLKEEIWKQQRNFKRENANLEYLKNVTFNFLTSSDKQGKKQMLKAIMTILQFSPREIDKVRTCSTI